MAAYMNFNKWDIESQLGRGGMGTVYHVRSKLHAKIERAIKVINPDIVHDMQSRKRLLNEVDLLEELQHPNIMKFYSIEEEEDKLFMVLELLRGKTIKALIEEQNEKPLQPKQALDIISQATTGLAYAHDKSIIHRDIKPGNIFLCEDGLVKILDFGLAKEANKKSITLDGAAVGTPAYMAPEIFNDEKPSKQSDIYALGLIFYQLLAGSLPFTIEEDSSLMVMLGQLFSVHSKPLPSIAEKVPGLSLGLVEIVDKAIKQDPSERYRDAGSFGEQLSSVDITIQPKVSKPVKVKAADPVLEAQVSKKIKAPVTDVRLQTWEQFQDTQDIADEVDSPYPQSFCYPYVKCQQNLISLRYLQQQAKA